jgi:DNA-binding transcriptional LysR family regulator
MQEWTDLKFFLVTTRTGSTLAAARELGVNQTTVARRIDALETALSVRLFHRNRDGYRLSEEGAAILTQAERVATEIETLERLAAQRNRHVSNVIRVTTVEDVANVILTPWLSEFIDLHPGIKVEMIATETRLDLARGEADIAIRASPRLTESGVIVRKLADGRWTLYCSRSYAAKYGVPNCVEDLDRHLIIGAEGTAAKVDPSNWLAKVAPRATVRSVCSTVPNTLVAIRAGHGIGALPTPMGIGHPDLIECFNIPGFDFGYYLVTPESLKNVACVKAFTAFIVARAPALKRALEGEGRGTAISDVP